MESLRGSAHPDWVKLASGTEDITSYQNEEGATRALIAHLPRKLS